MYLRGLCSRCRQRQVGSGRAPCGLIQKVGAKHNHSSCGSEASRGIACKPGPTQVLSRVVHRVVQIDATMHV